MTDDIIRMAREAGFNKNELAYLGDNFQRLVDLTRADERKRIADIIRSDKYGIGNMCSQWTSDDVADDILEGQV